MSDEQRTYSIDEWKNQVTTRWWAIIPESTSDLNTLKSWIISNSHELGQNVLFASTTEMIRVNCAIGFQKLVQHAKNEDMVFKIKPYGDHNIEV